MTAAPDRPPATVLARVPGVFRVRRAEDLDDLPFHDGIAAVEVPAQFLAKIRFDNDMRERDARLAMVAASIRAHGFVPTLPIVVALQPDGAWSVVDGGHRLTAARRVMREVWTNLWRRKVQTVYFLVFRSQARAEAVASLVERAELAEEIARIP